MKFSFFHQRHALSMSFELSKSFDIFVVNYRVTNFLPKLVDMLLFSNFLNSPIFGYCREPTLWWGVGVKTLMGGYTLVEGNTQEGGW